MVRLTCGPLQLEAKGTRFGGPLASLTSPVSCAGWSRRPVRAGGGQLSGATGHRHPGAEALQQPPNRSDCRFGGLGTCLVEAKGHHCRPNREKGEASWPRGGYPTSIAHGRKASWWWPILQDWKIFGTLHTMTALCTQDSESLCQGRSYSD